MLGSCPLTFLIPVSFNQSWLYFFRPGCVLCSHVVKRTDNITSCKLIRGLQGADEMDSIERDEKEQQQRFKNIAKELDEFEDPTGGLGVSGAPKGKRLARLEAETEKARQTDIAIIEDEYE